MADPQIMALFVAQSLNDPAPDGAIAGAERELGRSLPGGLREFLAVSNGYDDALGKGYLSLWPAGQLALRNEGYEVASKIDDVVLIGSNGGDTCYAIDWSDGAPQFIVAAPDGAMWFTEGSGDKIGRITSRPTSKDQCKNGGWRTFPGFKNRGDCVSFVATGGKNPPSPAGA